MQMFRARCKRCEWIYDTVTLPMPLTEFAAAAKSAACPMCGNLNGNACADPRPLTEFERAHKAKFLEREAATGKPPPSPPPQDRRGKFL